MKYLSAYFRTAKSLLESYDGSIPLSVHLKAYFKKHKNSGSRDRKIISSICYNYFRCYHVNKNLPISQALEISWEIFQPKETAEETGFSTWTAEKIFPLVKEISPQLDAEAFARSMFLQPDTFLRCRPGKLQKVTSALDAASMSYLAEGNSLRLPPQSRLQGIIEPDKFAVVQDINSQHVLDFLETYKKNHPGPILLYDCCAASGGKSILAWDILKQEVKLTVSDIRTSILEKFTARMLVAGIPVKEIIKADLSQEVPFEEIFDIVIADVPCTGSGTWARTPEQLAFSGIEKVQAYSRKQIAIARNAIKAVKPGGLFFYITCSVFTAENEKITSLLEAEENMDLVESKYLPGYNVKADTLFISIFKKIIS